MNIVQTLDRTEIIPLSQNFTHLMIHVYYNYDKTMYIQRNTEVHLCNHCCSGKAVSITYSECTSVALVIQHAKSIRHIIFLPTVFCSIIFFPHYLINSTIFFPKIVLFMRLVVDKVVLGEVFLWIF